MLMLSPETVVNGNVVIVRAALVAATNSRALLFEGDFKGSTVMHHVAAKGRASGAEVLLAAISLLPGPPSNQITNPLTAHF